MIDDDDFDTKFLNFNNYFCKLFFAFSNNKSSFKGVLN